MRSLYKSGSLKTATRGLARRKLDIVGIQEVRWEKRSTVKPGDYILFYKKETKTMKLANEFLYTTDYCQQLSELSLLVMQCHVHA